MTDKQFNKITEYLFAIVFLLSIVAAAHIIPYVVMVMERTR